MGIALKKKSRTVKLVLPEDLAERLRDLRTRAEEAGFTFDLDDEVAEALNEIERKLRSSP